MNKSILIFTDNYPFGRSEPFLESELSFIEPSFEKIVLFPIETGRDKTQRVTKGNLELERAIFVSFKSRNSFLIKGLFNKAKIGIFLGEGIRSGVWKSWSKFRIWFTHLLMIRGILSEIDKRDFISFINDFDILYFYWGLRWSQIIPFLPPGIKAKILVRFHGSDLYEHTNKGYIPWRFEQLNRIEKAVAISETGKKYIENQYPFLKDRIIVSRIGTKDYGLNKHEKSDTLRIVSCSNLVQVKRVELIAKTLTLIKSNVNWVHFGDGPEMNNIKQLALKLPENIKVDLKGSVRHEELMSYYRDSPVDLFINVSSSEGVPVSVMEAMSFGIPVIATNVGGTSEVVSEKIGLLVEPDFSPEYLAGKIETLFIQNDLSVLRSAARREWEKNSQAEILYPDFVNQILHL